MPSTVQSKDEAVQAPAKTPKSTSKPKADEAKKVSKPKAPFFRTLGENKDLALVLEGLEQPVRRGSWAAMVALLLLDQDPEATEESIAQAWALAAEKNGETYPGKDGLYHTEGNDHAQKTVLASTTYGARKAIRLLHNRGLIEARDGKPFVIKDPLKRFVGKVEATISSKPRRTRRPRPAGSAPVSSRKGRTSRVSK